MCDLFMLDLESRDQFHQHNMKKMWQAIEAGWSREDMIMDALNQRADFAKGKVI